MFEKDQESSSDEDMMWQHSPLLLRDFFTSPETQHPFKNSPSPFTFTNKTNQKREKKIWAWKLITMALARLALRNLQQRVSSSSAFVSHNDYVGAVGRQRWSNELLKRFMATSANGEKTEGKEIQVTEKNKKSRLFPRRKSWKSLWRKNDIPSIYGNLS